MKSMTWQENDMSNDKEVTRRKISMLLYPVNAL